MGGFQDFAQVLEQKIRREIESEILAEDPVSRGENVYFTREFDDSPRGMAWLLGKMPKSLITDPRGRTAYGVKSRLLPPHKLNVFQVTAVLFFKIHGVLLSPRFTQKELKTAFRQLAKKLHPDQGGTTEAFLDLLESFKILAEI